MKSLTFGVMSWEGKQRKATRAAKNHGEHDACEQPLVEQLAPQGIGEGRALGGEASSSVPVNALQWEGAAQTDGEDRTLAASPRAWKGG